MNPLSRREFLAGAACAAAAAPLSPGSQAPSNRVVVAVVGVRGMGRAHLRNLVKRSDVHLAALCDVDEAVLGQAMKEATGRTPAPVRDFRRLLDDKTIDALVIATPHHWHAPIAVRALQAGKDVYIEKPASHVFREGRLILEAAKQHKRVVQHGTQMRSSDVTAKAAEVLKSGILGPVKMTKALNLQRHSHRKPVPDAPTPPGVDYEMWLGPAPARKFNPNRFHGNWQWYRDYGNGDIGNDGTHDLDMAHFGLSVTTHPVKITAHGSKIDLVGEREYPDNMVVAFYYGEGKVLIYEDRGWTPYSETGQDSSNIFYGTEGYMTFTRRGHFQVYLGRKQEKGPSYRGNTGHPDHLVNFLDCVRTRKEPVASAEVAHLSCALVHLGEIASRTERVLHFDPKTETITNDKAANALLTKEYRAPWEMPNG